MASRWGPRVDVRPLLGHEQDALLAYLRSLSADQWDVVTAAAPWRVRDVTAHVLGDHLGRLSRSRDREPPPVRAPGEGLGPFLHHFNAQWVAATARMSTWVLLELLGDVGPRVVDHWQRLDLDGLGEPVSWASPEPAPAWLDAARDYTECWVHQQQIREATGGGLFAAPRFFAPVLDTFARALPLTLRHLAGRFRDTQVTLVVTGDSGGTWTVRSDGWRWLFNDAPARPGAMSVRVGEDSFWRLCVRSLSPERAHEAVEGDADPAVLDAVRSMTAIIV